ncbi:MAG: hypothetical protein AAFX06_16495 [Planctomycetota bacterium]
MIPYRTILYLVCAISVSATLRGQEVAENPNPESKSRFESIDALLDSAPNENKEKPIAGQLVTPPSAGQRVTPPANMSKAVEEVYEKAVIAELRHLIWEMEHREKIYGWQHWAGIAVFLLAVGIVVAGMLMSWMQFRFAFSIGQQDQTERKTDPASGEGEDKSKPRSKRWNPFSQTHGFEMSPGSIKLSTSFVGVVILGMSLAFFYLYLKFVFEIS